MKLLFDENLSHKLSSLLTDIFPDSVHVRDVGLKKADDSEIWKYAKNHLTIVSKDLDMHQRSSVFGHPPKIIWIKLGNCSTSEVEQLLRKYANSIKIFYQNQNASFLSLS